ncbi:hypothetical protein LWI29_021789 [Acer saccharum]|uniref:Uncharacterized protein n=1 Tax=Acer saccharum TaxID=4024 RepID=A0AA39T1F6_ACESA|nr:hypothetical protein LWI29_021789 [Acer saccharum]
MYEVEIESGIEVKAKFKSLLIEPSLVYENICELKSLLQLQTPVAGLDVKLQPGNWPWTGNSTARMMILCVANHCLIIQLDHFDVFPESRKKFLTDETICFVGRELSHKLASLHDDIETGVEVRDLAARVLKKPCISTFGLADLAREVEVVISSSVAEAATDFPATQAPGSSAPVDDWNTDRVFTDEVDWSARVFTHVKMTGLLSFSQICFVGRELGRKLATLPRVGNNNNYNNAVTCNTGVEVGDLAARVLKKPYISELGLAYLANEAGVSPSVAWMVFSSTATGGSPWIDLSAMAFTEDEIKCVIREAIHVTLLAISC